MTQTLIVHVIRTNLIPFIQSRASWQLTTTTIIIMAIGAYLPFSPLATYLGFVPLPPHHARRDTLKPLPGFNSPGLQLV
jgi:P-type Mg2+ transporter